MIHIPWNSKYPPSGASTLFGNECIKCQRKICAGILSRIKQRFQTILLVLLIFNYVAFFRITAHINVVRALLGQMSCSVTWESTQKKRHTCAVYAKRLLAAVIIWASTLELMTPVGKRMFRIRTVMVKNLATQMVENSSVMLMIAMMCLRMMIKKIIELMDRLTLDWKDGKPLVIKIFKTSFKEVRSWMAIRQSLQLHNAHGSLRRSRFC